MKKSIQAAFVLTALALVSCQDEKIKEKVDTNGAIEITLKTQPLGDSTIYSYYQTIYYKKEVLKKHIFTDTLPSLGDTIQEFEDESKVWKQSVQKQYKFFVTVE